MTDDALTEAFESATVEPSQWDHRAHLRVAYTLLRRHGLEEAFCRVRAGLQELQRLHNIPDALDRGYHETITRGFLHVLDAMIRVHGPGESSEAFFEAQPQLTSRYLMRLYYSRERIMSAEAKRTFVEPDLAPFPVALHHGEASS